MDITKLIQPITFEAPPLGQVSISVRTVEFLSWFDRGRANGSWHDGLALVRSMLGEQANSDDPDGNGFAADDVGRLRTACSRIERFVQRTAQSKP